MVSYAPKYKLYGLFGSDIITSYDAEFDASKKKLYGLFGLDIITSYDAEFELFIGCYYAFGLGYKRIFGLITK